MSRTGMIVVICAIVLAIYDGWQDATGGLPSTISRFFSDAGLRSPALMLAIGIIAGHLVASMVPTVESAFQDAIDQLPNGWTIQALASNRKLLIQLVDPTGKVAAEQDSQTSNIDQLVKIAKDGEK